ncbi:hypothetical protein Y032_0097g3045 [Ancylostoma ceylanicum]|uniref:Uncharacterized protein n=1 Tax=Ancylostoma ceylanicum TaxID=53326 RepID=A0A016TJV9_9BILA|nr:hypothetical protein Y032_0097g3045 [Ancylostoma ceylanicum]
MASDYSNRSPARVHWIIARSALQLCTQLAIKGNDRTSCLTARCIPQLFYTVTLDKMGPTAIIWLLTLVATVLSVF